MEPSASFYKKLKSNYDKTPSVAIAAESNPLVTGWDKIVGELKQAIVRRRDSDMIIAVEYYPGVNEEELLQHLIGPLGVEKVFDTGMIFKSVSEIEELTAPDVTDDPVFGFITRLTYEDFLDPIKLDQTKKEIKATRGIRLVYGYGASLLTGEHPDLYIYADMPRWELQLRYRKREIGNLGLINKGEKASLQYKRGFFVDWRVADKQKKKTLPRWHYVLDTAKTLQPVMMEGILYRRTLEKTVQQPFRVVPFFDPGPWGGQWMKWVCNLDPEAPNYAWCFDCVPEENSLLLKWGDTLFETPAINLVFYQSRALLGEAVQARFGDEFPIRFDLLDTMEGGNLSFQVHPTTEYVREAFGMTYTQDESYYILDAKEDTDVCMGLKAGIDPQAMIAELEEAQQKGTSFEVNKYVARWPVKKHDHYLIPAGTVHCSNRDTVVLEISATPYIFTFKLWDWGRLGLDGKPRPINIYRGREVIDWRRTEAWVAQNLVNRIEKVAEGDGWIEERTGLHEREFIETRRHWFSKPVYHKANGSVTVFNLVEGEEAIVESPEGNFEPFVVHYAETFIIPASVPAYRIRPYGKTEGRKVATIKAFVRHNP